MKDMNKENVTLLDVLVSLPDSSSVNGITPAKLSIKYNISEMSSKRALDILVEMGLASVLECETYIESSESEDFLRVLNALQLSLVG
ncbi:hypothetical protein [Candidatus Methanomassiliicoccus intestinalis]|uniref:hypothetical protein n=1 Tax=Candidatus Methanomassiliicoccus intestinalis TaxID=1406512 RepID=UPI0037DC5321